MGGGAAGLAIARGHYLGTVHRRVRARADEVGLPILTLPLNSRLAEIADAVEAAVLDRRYQALRHADGVQRALSRILLGGGDLPALIERASELLGNPLVLLDADGPAGRREPRRGLRAAARRPRPRRGRAGDRARRRPAAARRARCRARPAAAARSRSCRCSRSGPTTRRRSTTWRRSSRSSSCAASSCGWPRTACAPTWCGTRSPRASPPTTSRRGPAPSAPTSTAPQVAVTAGVDDARRGARPPRPRRHRGAGGASCGCSSPRSRRRWGAPRWSPATATRRSRCCRPSAADDLRDRLAAAATALAHAEPGLVLAAGWGRAAALGEHGRSLAEARRARALGAALRSGGAHGYEDVAVYDALLGEGAPGAARQLAAHTLGPLTPELRRTLEVHLQGGLSVARTAEALFLHRNTVRYRLGQIERLTGAAPRRARGPPRARDRRRRGPARPVRLRAWLAAGALALALRAHGRGAPGRRAARRLRARARSSATPTSTRACAPGGATRPGDHDAPAGADGDCATRAAVDRRRRPERARRRSTSRAALGFPPPPPDGEPRR